MTESSTLEKFRLALHGVTAPFACSGTLVPPEPMTFVFKDGTRFTVTRARESYHQHEELSPLLERCKPAGFGDKKKTRYDRSVRDALQLNAAGGAFAIEGFDSSLAGILKDVHRELTPHDPSPLMAELYSVNVYTNGGHFATHKDTPRGCDMIGSLVVCLPSQFSNGRLTLIHRGVVQCFDWAEAVRKQKEPARIHWAAFFGDVDHRIETVWGGARVTLAYHLRRGVGAAGGDEPGANLEPRVRLAWRELLDDAAVLPKGGIIGYPCCHLYHQDARFQQEKLVIDAESASMLKGRDRLIADAALNAGVKVDFVPYLFENCGDAQWVLRRFPTRAEERRLDDQMDDTDLERALPILGYADDGPEIEWIESPPASYGSTWSEDKEEAELPAAGHLHNCDYCAHGYFGNESSEVDFYTYAALHLRMPPFGRGIRNSSRAVAVVAKPTTGRKPRKPSGPKRK